MTTHEKEQSRQKQIWFSFLAIILIAIGSFTVKLNDPQAMVLSAIVLGLAGKEGANLFSTPKGKDDG